MRTIQWKQWWLILVFIPMMTACSSVKSKHPLTTLQNATPEHGLYGLWRIKQSTGHYYVHVLPNKRGYLDLIVLSAGMEHNNIGRARALSLQIGQHRYLSIQTKSSTKGWFQEHLIVRYSRKKETLVIHHLNYKAFAKATKAKLLKGGKRGTHSNEIFLTDTPKNIVAFIKKLGKRSIATNNKYIWKRVLQHKYTRRAGGK